MENEQGDKTATLAKCKKKSDRKAARKLKKERNFEKLRMIEEETDTWIESVDNLDNQEEVGDLDEEDEGIDTDEEVRCAFQCFLC